jgi:hypothetical protein
MVARDGERRSFERIEKRARGAELRDGGALRQIAGQHDQVRVRLAHRRDQRVEQRRIDAAGVEIGEVDERTHVTPPR